MAPTDTCKFPPVSSWPVGFGFRPTEEELITYYLKNKNLGHESLVESINEIDLYKYDPKELPAKSFFGSNDSEWFFFRANTSNTERTTATGDWRSTAEPYPIKAPGTNKKIGTKQFFVFHRGQKAKAVKTNWVIHEYQPHPNTNIPTQKSFVIFRLKKENAEERHVSIRVQEDGQNSTVASAGKKKVTHGGKIQEPGSGASKNGDNLTQRRSHVSIRDQGQNSTVASARTKKVKQEGGEILEITSYFDFRKHVEKSVLGENKNRDEMTSNNHVDSHSKEELDKMDSKKKVTQVGAIQESNHEIGRLRRIPPTVKPFPCTVAPTSGTSTDSDNSHPSHPKKKVTQIGAIQESNLEIGRLNRDHLDIRPFSFTVDKRKSKERPPGDVVSAEGVAGTSANSTDSENSHRGGKTSDSKKDHKKKR